jgi:hypothetical protein
MSHDVYKVSYVFPTAPTHCVLFVETDDNGFGSIFHVRGSIRDGMEYEIRNGIKPQLQPHFSRMDLIGTVTYAKLSDIMGTCESIPPPGIQVDDHDEKINADAPLYCCGEWLDDVIQALKDRKVLENIV